MANMHIYTAALQMLDIVQC